MYTRRQFLSKTGRAGASALALGSLGLSKTMLATENFADYKALVCILLAGGNDSYNMLVPYDNDQYTEYRTLRSDLALDQSTLLPLNQGTPDGRNLALHQGMPEVQTLYVNQDLSFLANVGTLLEPVDEISVENGAQVPLGLYSHADQIQQWQTARSEKRVADGWAGRIGDLFQGTNLVDDIPMNVSLSGTNVFQSGIQTSEYAITPRDNGASGILFYNNNTDFGDYKKRVIDNLLEHQPSHPLRREYQTRLKAAVASSEFFIEAMDTGHEITTNFSDHYFSQSLRQIARVIAARDALGAVRQTFFIQFHGWDHHDDVLPQQEVMLPQLSKGLSEFRDALVEIDMFDSVTTFTTSDFGRTLTSNGKGSDHGWGGHHIAMGGRVRGGRIFGDYPLLSPNSPLDVGRGIYVPTTSVDEYFAELALWFGVSSNDLVQILPNINRFYSPYSTDTPIGFLT